MNQILKTLFVFLVIASSVFGQTVEIKKMSDILDSVTPDSVVVFDLDNTIMEAAQTLGSDQWFDYRIAQLKKDGIDIEGAVKEAVKEWVQIGYKGRVQLVEQNTPAIVRHIQESGIPTMGLTARPTEFMDKSLQQLRDLDVPFYLKTVSQDEVEVQGNEPAIYREGLMSVGGNNKGTMFVSFLNKVEFHPQRVLFVDDKSKNVKNVGTALDEATIPFFGFRYGAADKKVAAFDPKLADFEYTYFANTGTVLNDSQAKKLMH